MIVADTNLIFYLLVSGAFTRESWEVYKRDPEWAAPSLWRSEFRSALTTCMRRGLLGLGPAIAKMEAAESLMEDSEFEVDSKDVLQLALESGCSAYDFEFVALARHLRIPLVTTDSQLLAKFGPVAISPQAFCAH